jgi:hypothetical protein
MSLTPAKSDGLLAHPEYQQRDPMMKSSERREKARLRSERWRRAHGIMPRRPAQRPWLTEGISRSTWYRRQKKAREQAAAAQAAMTRQAALDRLEWQMTRLRADLETAARFADEGAAILAELAAMTSRPAAW